MRQRSRTQISESLDQALRGYALVALASAAAAASFSRALQAEVVYTAANAPIPYPQYRQGPAILPIDLNNDGIADFYLANFNDQSCGSGFCITYGSFYAQAPRGVDNSVVAVSSSQSQAAALPLGAPLAPDGAFIKYGMMMKNVCLNGGSSDPAGQWLNAQSRYLGFKFLINGETHYGWARLTTKNSHCGTATGTLTGYAYETVANQQIITGGPMAWGGTPPANRGLGRLARGAIGTKR